MGRGASRQQDLDIVLVEWGPVPGGYSTSITVAGTARDGVEYNTAGTFRSEVSGETCELRHHLTPGTTAFAVVTCGIEEAGRVQGSRVTSSTTRSGGTRLAATFDSRAVPPLLEAAGRRLHDLWASTCVAPRCFWANMWDSAQSELSYRV
jgi:hypothetical protein